MSSPDEVNILACCQARHVSFLRTFVGVMSSCVRRGMEPLPRGEGFHRVNGRPAAEENTLYSLGFTPPRYIHIHNNKFKE